MRKNRRQLRISLIFVLLIVNWLFIYSLSSPAVVYSAPNCTDASQCGIDEWCDIRQGVCRKRGICFDYNDCPGTSSDYTCCAEDEYCDSVRQSCFLASTCEEGYEVAECDYSGNTCDEERGKTEASSGCSLYKTVRCECTNECTINWCGNTRCLDYKHICIWRENCPPPTPKLSPSPKSTQPPQPTNTPPLWPTNTPRPRVTNTPPVPTSTPENPPTVTPGGPTSTPSPSITPGGPTLTPSPVVPPATPTPAPYCDCDFIEMTSNVFKGESVTITTYAKVPHPDKNNAEVRYMVYHIYHCNLGTDECSAETGREVFTKRVDIPEDYTPIFVPSEDINRYVTSINYTIEDFGAYYVKTDIRCGVKAETQEFTSIQEKTGLFEQMINFLRNILGFTRTDISVKGKIDSKQGDYILSSPPVITVVVPMGNRSLQLGTFYPGSVVPTPTIKKACKELWFVVKN